MTGFYAFGFWLPGIAAGVSLLFAWRSGILSRIWPLLAMLVLGVALQTVGEIFSPAWAVGLVCNAALASYLLVKIKVDG